jgi:hypothetical protein
MILNGNSNKNKTNSGPAEIFMRNVKKDQKIGMDEDNAIGVKQEDYVNGIN